MSLKPLPGTITAEIDREAVLSYQASYLAQRFALSLVAAREFVDRFGLDRKALNQAVREHLIQSTKRRA